MKFKLGKRQRLVVENFINVFVLSILTGLFVGIVVTFYNICANLGERYSQSLYSLVRDNPAFVPLLFAGLAAGGIVVGTAVRFVPMIRGSGIPQIEGAARGVIRFKWYVTMCSMFAASLACIFMGLAAGAEGPSLEIGGCAGSAVGTLLKRNHMTRRLQIAAGSGAGFAVAFNAPFTGLVFALEEAFRSFSPQIFFCAAISIASALFTGNAIRGALGFGLEFSLTTFTLVKIDALSCLWVALAAIITALAGVGFYHLALLAKKLFAKIKFLKGVGKFVIPFVLAGVFGLLTIYAMGGGKELISHLGSGSEETVTVFGLGLLASLAVIILIRLITATISIGCGVPCGVFIPMLAIGACCGAILSSLFQICGMDGAYSDYLIIICMAVFFTCVVKAPVTGLVMIIELTGQFTNFLPAVMGVAIGYLIGTVFKTEPLYEKSLASYISEEKVYEKVQKERVTLTVLENSYAAGEKVRSIIWPANGLVVERISPDGTKTVPDGETILYSGDQITFVCETDNLNELCDYLYEIVGKPEK